MQKHLQGIALLLLLALIAAAVLGILALSTASSDLKIAQRQAEYVSGTTECINKANRWLWELQAKAAAGELAGQTIEETFTDGEGRYLKACVVCGENGPEIKEWVCFAQWDADRRIENLFDPDK